MITEWSGPAWAAPESAERIRTGAEVSPASPDRQVFGALCYSLAEGHLTAEHFRGALQLRRRAGRW